MSTKIETLDKQQKRKKDIIDNSLCGQAENQKNTKER
jgi:hypothetical protein